jgi:hypothetical protein
MVQDRTLCVWLLERYSETLAVQEKNLDELHLFGLFCATHLNGMKVRIC